MVDKVLTWYATAAELKRLKRSGWLRCGVAPEQAESVAEHALGVGLLALVLPAAAGLAVDRDRCVALALVHDLAEAIVGDLTPHDPIGPEEKHRRERAGMEQMAATLGDGGAELLALWEEYEAGATAEARLVRELDVIEMAWQARAYQRAGLLTAEQADAFLATARQRVRSDEGRQLLDRIDATGRS
jgi:putative hydrolase of HD superfamily